MGLKKVKIKAGEHVFNLTLDHRGKRVLFCKYWLAQTDKNDVSATLLYVNGSMKAAYGTFLTSLLVIKAHDMVADQAAS